MGTNTHPNGCRCLTCELKLTTPAELGAGCGIAADGIACTPAYLCDPCAKALIAAANGEQL